MLPSQPQPLLLLPHCCRQHNGAPSNASTASLPSLSSLPLQQPDKDGGRRNTHTQVSDINIVPTLHQPPLLYLQLFL